MLWLQLYDYLQEFTGDGPFKNQRLLDDQATPTPASFAYQMLSDSAKR